MGMHIGLIAVKGNVEDLQREFTSVWEKYELSDSKSFNSFSDAWAWKQSNEKFVSAAKWSKENPGQETYLLWQDGSWALLMDLSYVISSDKKALALLSGKFGKVLSFIVESTSGCAYFWSYDAGKEIRSIENNSGVVEVTGLPLPEESGIDIGSYYMNETEALWNAFGITNVNSLKPNASYHVISVIDRTNYEELRAKSISRQENMVSTAPVIKKPWWKFW